MCFVVLGVKWEYRWRTLRRTREGSEGKEQRGLRGGGVLGWLGGRDGMLWRAWENARAVDENVWCFVSFFCRWAWWLLLHWRYSMPSSKVGGVGGWLELKGAADIFCQRMQQV